MGKATGLFKISKGILLWTLVVGLTYGCASTTVTTKKVVPIPVVMVTGKISNLEEIKTKLEQNAYLALIYVDPRGKITMELDDQGRVTFITRFQRLAIPPTDTFTYVAQNVEPGKYFLVAQIAIQTQQNVGYNTFGDPASAAVFSNAEGPVFIEVPDNMDFANSFGSGTEGLIFDLGEGALLLEWGH